MFDMECDQYHHWGRWEKHERGTRKREEGRAEGEQVRATGEATKFRRRQFEGERGEQMRRRGGKGEREERDKVLLFDWCVYDRVVIKRRILLDISNCNKKIVKFATTQSEGETGRRRKGGRVRPSKRREGFEKLTRCVKYGLWCIFHLRKEACTVKRLPSNFPKTHQTFLLLMNINWEPVFFFVCSKEKIRIPVRMATLIVYLFFWKKKLLETYSQRTSSYAKGSALPWQPTRRHQPGLLSLPSASTGNIRRLNRKVR